METTTKTAAAMTAARVTCDAWYGSNTAHSGDLFAQVQGRSVPVVGLVPMRERIAGLVGATADVAGVDAPATGSAYPRLEGPPV
ncbi:hypothetical protein [Phycicoccus flavus]|uniref:hypothetical protein n=1 Tax=Phycicoccus flavus TaxID=2502783 RepID=UPI000FEBDD20|nr:hypothetical protein [Phycicoccus flavus]NHA66916.1 hypothetical protein [Phycicoccus flavus]